MSLIDIIMQRLGLRPKPAPKPTPKPQWLYVDDGLTYVDSTWKVNGDAISWAGNSIATVNHDTGFISALDRSLTLPVPAGATVARLSALCSLGKRVGAALANGGVSIAIGSVRPPGDEFYIDDASVSKTQQREVATELHIPPGTKEVTFYLTFQGDGVTVGYERIRATFG